MADGAVTKGVVLTSSLVFESAGAAFVVTGAGSGSFSFVGFGAGF